MNMERSKNIIIVMLLAINLSLGAFVYAESREHTLKQSRIDTIRSVLTKNGIAMYDSPIENFAPKKQLSLKEMSLSDSDILSLFFGNGYVEIYQDGDTEVFTTGEFTAEKSGGFVDFYAEYFEAGEITPPETAAYEICDEFIGRLEKILPNLNMKRDYLNVASGGRRIIEYRAVYKDVIVESCSARFTLTEKGVAEIRLSLLAAQGITGDAREIFAYDEALFRLMYRLKGDYGDVDGINITDMKIVYAADEKNANAAPYYRFYVRPGANQPIRDEPYLVNAYTNAILN